MITNIRRYATEKLTSVEDDLLSYQHGIVASVTNATATYIANPFQSVALLNICPVKLGTTSGNNTAFATGYEVETEAAVVADLPAFANSTAYVAGVIVRYNGVAYLCNTSHTSAPSGGPDSNNFTELPTTKFIKITHTAAGVGKVTYLKYLLSGYYQ